MSFGQVSVLTQHNDNSRTGQNLQETVLNTSTVNVSNFGKLFSLPVDGNIYVQPLYVPNLTHRGQDAQRGVCGHGSRTACTPSMRIVAMRRRCGR